jgi:uncharacterized protein
MGFSSFSRIKFTFVAPPHHCRRCSSADAAALDRRGGRIYYTAPAKVAGLVAKIGHWQSAARIGGGMKLLLMVVGLAFILEGIPWFLSPRRVLSLLRELARLPEGLLRGCGLLAMVLGLLLVWMGR